MANESKFTPEFEKWMEENVGEDALHPDLEAYLSKDGALGTMIQHPLVFSVVHNPMMNRMVNRQLAKKREIIAKLKTQGKWAEIVWCYERPYRMQAYDEVCMHLSVEDQWSLLGDLWTDSENIHQCLHRWIYHLDREDRDPSAVEWFSDEEGVDLYRNLPDTFEVYRGYCTPPGTKLGMSWTTDPAIAVWFALRFHREGDGCTPMVVEATAHKADVIGVLQGRKESEVVVSPHSVLIQNTCTIDPNQKEG